MAVTVTIQSILIRPVGGTGDTGTWDVIEWDGRPADHLVTERYPEAIWIPGGTMMEAMLSPGPDQPRRRQLVATVRYAVHGW